jgi:integrase
MRRLSAPLESGPEDNHGNARTTRFVVPRIFRFNGKRYAQTLNTTNPRDANSLKGGIEKTIMLLQQHVLKVPDAVDPLAFIMAGGELPPPSPEQKLEEKPSEAKSAEKPKSDGIQSLRQLCDRYAQTLALSVEENSLATVKMHLRHVTRSFGADFDPNDIKPGRLQEYIEHRARRKGIRKRPLSAYTIRKELTTIRAAWNWAKQMLLIEPAFPDAPLKFPKMREKQPFQTFAEIESRIASGVTEAEQKELWDCLFLSISEINELLEHVKAIAQQPFVYPMFCFAAHTGARRSEILRLKKSDIDLSSSVALIHEKKRVCGTTTTRRVTLSPFLKGALSEWLASHPGGQHLFTQHVAVFRSRKRRLEATPVTRNEATDHFERTLAGSKWAVVRGWHVFRHSFASSCAACGIDQRLIDEWLGHQTEEMRRRYRHCFPNVHVYRRLVVVT